MGVLTKIRHYYGAYRLTLSGDVSIASGSPTFLYELEGEKREEVQRIISELLNEYPFLKIEIKDGITETEISFFSYDSAMAEADFLEHFCLWLKRFSECVSESGKSIVTINFSGVLCNVCQSRKFRILNKGMEIQYRFTAENSLPLISGLTHSRYFRFLETILIILLLFFLFYDMTIEETPGKLV